MNATEQHRYVHSNTDEKSIAIQNMRVQRYDRAVKDDNGSKELVDLRNRIKVFNNDPDQCIYVSLVFFVSVS